MPSQHNEKPQWRHPHGMDVLKRLGIIERSTNSVSEGDDEFDKTVRLRKEDMLALNDEAPNGGEFMNDDSDDNEFIFDRASLLSRRQPSSDDERTTSWFSNRRTQSMAESRRIFCCRGFLATLAFFIVGLCTSLLGPTLGNLPALTNPNTGLTSVISANAFGAMLGVILCTGCNTLLNTFCIMMFALPLCSVSTLVVPWCTTLTGATMVFMLQGVAYGFVERGCYSVFQAYWRRRHSILILFYIAFALGATMSPLIASSFFVLKQADNASWVENSSSSPVIRSARSAQLVADAGNSSFSALCNGTIENCAIGNDTSVNTVSTAPPLKVKKPSVSDATALDHKQTNTEKKEEALKTQEQQKVADLLSNAKSVGLATSGNGTGKSDVADAKGVTTTTSVTSPTTTTSTSTTSTTTTPTTATTTSTIATTTTITSASPASKAEIAGSSSSATTLTPTFTEETWAHMQKELARMNSYQLAYVTVASISIVLTALYAMVCCFTPCRRQGTTPSGASPSDYRLHLNGLLKSRSNVYAVSTAIAFAFLLVSLESVLSNLLTIYYTRAVDALRLHSAIVTTSLFWLCASVARIMAACFHGRLSQTVPMASCLGVALFSTGVAVVFSYWTVVCLVAAILGLSYGCLYPLTFCWLDQQLSPAPWFVTIWCLAGQAARMIAPFCASAAMFHHSTKDFLFALLVISLFACITFVLMRSAVREAARLISVEQQQRVTCKVKFGGGDTLFEYHHFDHSDGHAERDEDEVTYFDRSRDARMANGGSAPLFELNPKKFDRH